MIGTRLLTNVLTPITIHVVVPQLPVLFKFQQCEEDVSKRTIPVALAPRATTRNLTTSSVASRELTVRQIEEPLPHSEQMLGGWAR